jgi:hypothetical protein
MLPAMFTTALLDAVSNPRISPPLQFKTPLLVMFNEPEIIPPAQSMIAKVPLAGMTTLPELIMTWSLAVGTSWGVQLVALFQSLETAPVHVMVSAMAVRGFIARMHINRIAALKSFIASLIELSFPLSQSINYLI